MIIIEYDNIILGGMRMIKVISVTEAVRNFSDIIGRIRYKRESFLLTKGGTLVARIDPVNRNVKAKEIITLLKEIPHLTPESAREFAKDLEESRTFLKEAKDKWES